MESRGEFIKQEHLDGKQPRQRSKESARQPNLRLGSANGRIDAAVPPVAETNVEDSGQQAQTQRGARTEGGGNCCPGNANPLTKLQRLNINRFALPPSL